MKTYTADEVLSLVRKEIDHSNRIIGRKNLNSTDYIVIGMVTEALKRDELKNSEQFKCEKCGVMVNEGQGYKTVNGFVCIICSGNEKENPRRQA